ncbi:hypothetical protein PFISCL1PPCAC_13843, partial [Pristionchus fissidentatus]
SSICTLRVGSVQAQTTPALRQHRSDVHWRRTPAGHSNFSLMLYIPHHFRPERRTQCTEQSNCRLCVVRIGSITTGIHSRGVFYKCLMQLLEIFERFREIRQTFRDRREASSRNSECPGARN